VRVLYTVTAFARDQDDVITPWLTETIDRLRQRGVDVEVLAPSYRGGSDHTIGRTCVHRFRYAPGRLETLTHDQTAPDRIREHPRYALLVPGYVAAGALAAARLARAGRFDVVHAFWPLPHGIFGLAARRAGHIPLVCTFFGVELRWVRTQLPFFAPLLRSVIRRSAAVTAISGHTAAEVRRLVPDARIINVPFGAAIQPDPHHEPQPPQRGPGDPFRLLFTGRLVQRKGIAVLLQAMAELVGERRVHLTVVGDGPLRESLRERAAALGIGDRVEFTGFIPAAELGRRLRGCDAFVLPAVEDAKGDVEALGVVLIEALLHGRPVIASASGGIPEIVLHERTGLLTTPGSSSELAAAIRRLDDDPALALRLAARGREHVMQRFSWDTIIETLVDVYERAAAGRRRDQHGA
jgi:glycosyltransferase involved in cell wall biosynthesis